MTFPKTKDKHAFKPMFDTGFLFQNVNSAEVIPSKAILIYSRRIAEEFSKDLNPSEFELFSAKDGNYNFFSIHKSSAPEMLIIRISIGAPLTAMITDDLIRLGVKKILLIGEAGGIKQDLSSGDIVLCTKALRDEGASHHYIKGTRYVSPDADQTKTIAKYLKDAGIGFLKGPTWTTDGPYTETKEEVEKYSKAGIYTVEMEAAALFAVASKKGAKASAVFIVSDVLRLDSGWSNFERNESYAKGFGKLTTIAKLFSRI